MPGSRGIFPANNTLAPLTYPRILQAFLNMQSLAVSAGANLTDCTRLVVYVSDIFRYRPVVNQVQMALWGAEGPFPPRTIVEVQRLNEDDVCEVEGTFWLGRGSG